MFFMAAVSRVLSVKGIAKGLAVSVVNRVSCRRCSLLMTERKAR
jgi:hypothetical protein